MSIYFPGAYYHIKRTRWLQAKWENLGGRHKEETEPGPCLAKCEECEKARERVRMNFPTTIVLVNGFPKIHFS